MDKGVLGVNEEISIEFHKRGNRVGYTGANTAIDPIPIGACHGVYLGIVDLGI
jgi:hypothetical protein